MEIDIKKTIGWLLIFLAGMGFGVGGLMLFLFHPDVPSYLREKLTGETPQVKVDAFMGAIILGNRSTAVDLWYLDDLSPDSDKYKALQARREKVTDELLHAQIQPEYMILRTEWWRTCCEPGVICDARGAGGARLHIQLIDSQGLPAHYIFDVFSVEQPYWGAAMGYPPRHWVIRDIYPPDEHPIYWPVVFERKVRQIDAPTP